MQYRIVRGEFIHSLVEDITALIATGWVPQGGLCFCPNTHFPYTQAMIKHD